MNYHSQNLFHFDQITLVWSAAQPAVMVPVPRLNKPIHGIKNVISVTLGNKTHFLLPILKFRQINMPPFAI